MVQNAKNREGIVDLLKGICIILVCITHYEWTSAERKEMLFSWWVDMAVPIFMILSGYVYEKSLKRKGIVSLSKLYVPVDILKRTIRLTIPILVAYSLTLAWDSANLPEIRYDIFITFLQGGRGPGSYYYPVMMQSVFLLPVVGVLVSRYEEKGLLVCLVANAVYEILHVAYGIPVSSYRFLVFRYIFVLASGCYIALGKKVPTVISPVMFCTGVLFLCSYLYFGFKPKYVKDWVGTSFLASMYIVPVVWLLIRKCKLRFTPVEFLGKASYHIFAMQMLYYYSVASHVYQYVASRKVQLLISVVTPVCAGILLYFMEMPLTKLLQKTIDKKTQPTV